MVMICAHTGLFPQLPTPLPFRAVYGPALLPLIDAVNAVVARATPPSSIPEPHPLPWWDKMRYQIHGTWLVTAQEMHLLHLTSPTHER